MILLKSGLLKIKNKLKKLIDIFNRPIDMEILAKTEEERLRARIDNLFNL